MNGRSLSVLRRTALWAIPVVLLAALVWSAVPHDVRRSAPAKSSAAARAAGGTPPSSAAAGGADAAPPFAGEGGAAATATTPGGTARPHNTLAAGEITLGDLVGTDGQGHMRWQIKADDMVLQQAQQTVVLKGVRATFFDNDGTRMFVDGQSGAYNTRTRQITLDGGVHGRTSSGRELFADTVRYSPQTRQVEGIGHVRVVQERVIMYSDRMVSDLTLGQTHFFGHVHMTLR